VAKDPRAIGRETIRPDDYLAQLYAQGTLESGQTPWHAGHELADRYEQPPVDGQGSYDNLSLGMVSSPSGGPGAVSSPTGPAIDYYLSEEERMAYPGPFAHQPDRYDSVEILDDAQD
jgi:hypothetical protein